MSEDERRQRARSFGAHADAYDRARPGYPAEAARWLVPGEPRLVVELGAGTGKLTRALAGLGVPVLAVEPDARMRSVLDALELPGVRTAEGTAEAIPVPDGAADVVVSGSAFHWFDLDRVLPEAARVLAPRGVLSFAWNSRDDRVPEMAALSDLIRTGGQRRWIGDRPWEELVPAGGLFGPVERASFEHEFDIRRDEIADLLRSYSGVASRPPAEQRELEQRATALLEDDPVRLRFLIRAFRTSRE